MTTRRAREHWPNGKYDHVADGGVVADDGDALESVCEIAGTESPELLALVSDFASATSSSCRAEHNERVERRQHRRRRNSG